MKIKIIDNCQELANRKDFAFVGIFAIFIIASFLIGKFVMPHQAVQSVSSFYPQCFS